MNMIMIETDSPYAAPIPYRGQINFPQNVVFVAEKISILKELLKSLSHVFFDHIDIKFG